MSVPEAARGWAAVSVGGSHSCALRLDGSAFCWGRGAEGQLGVASPRGSCTRERSACEGGPRAVTSSQKFAQVSAGEHHTCARGAEGALFCWGESAQFQTGVDGAVQVPTPAAVLPDMRFVDVSAGATHSCAVRTNGVVYCWGEGRLGALGRGDTVTSVVPRPVVTEQRFVQVSAGRWRSCAIGVDRSLWCWGAEWESGDGSLDLYHERLSPHRIDGAPAMRQVSASTLSICGVGIDGVGYCWESNGFGQLGTGTLEGRVQPTALASTARFAQVSAGIVQSCGVDTEGRAMCWGNGTFGQLGIPRTGEYCGPASLECSRRPAPVFGMQRFAAVATGFGNHACGVTVTTAVLCWGLGADGQLGDGFTRDRQSLPVAVLAPAR